MIDHMSSYATDYDRTKAFYERVLAALGYALQLERIFEADPDGNNVEAICHALQ